VLVSAIFGGYPEKAVVRALEEEVWVSDEVLSELTGLGTRLGKKFSFEQKLRWDRSLLPLVSKMRRVKVHSRVVLSRDPKDDAYLSLARTVNADFLITGDKDLLTIARSKLKSAGLEGLSILSPREFVQRPGA